MNKSYTWYGKAASAIDINRCRPLAGERHHYKYKSWPIIIKTVIQSEIACLKVTTETLEQGVKYVQS